MNYEDAGGQHAHADPLRLWVLHQQRQLQLCTVVLADLEACTAGFSLSQGQDWCLHVHSVAGTLLPSMPACVRQNCSAGAFNLQEASSKRKLSQLHGFHGSPSGMQL